MARFGKRRFHFKRNVDIGHVVKKVAYTIIALWVGGTIVNIIGNIVLDTCSPFYEGLRLIGWTVNSTSCITATSGTGILAVIGVIGIASIVLEFIDFKM